MRISSPQSNVDPVTYAVMSSSTELSRNKREDLSDALSQNITMILEDLLKDYDKTERPTYKMSK